MRTIQKQEKRHSVERKIVIVGPESKRYLSRDWRSLSRPPFIVYENRLNGKFVSKEIAEFLMRQGKNITVIAGTEEDVLSAKQMFQELICEFKRRDIQSGYSIEHYKE